MGVYKKNNKINNKIMISKSEIILNKKNNNSIDNRNTNLINKKYNGSIVKKYNIINNYNISS